MIPQIIHQIWIGNLPCPTKMMETWRNKHPDFEYKLWTDEHLKSEKWVCRNQMKLCPELCGVADIMRLEILWKYGGIFIDADSVCIEPLDDIIMNNTGFAVFENEEVRTGLIANGVIGFCKEHPLIGDMIDEIHSGILDNEIPQMQSWKILGPTLITRFLNSGKYSTVSIFPSYYFFPEHHTKIPIYDGHKKVYAHQWWGTSNQSYNELQTYQLPAELLSCSEGVSILATSYNTSVGYVHDCLESIRNQRGNFYIELVWVNDGSDISHTNSLERELQQFREHTRFCTVKYLRTDENLGVGHGINNGMHLCTYDLIFKMDADDIMYPTRIMTQMKYMKENPECQICGTQIQMFRLQQNTDNKINKIICGQTTHAERVNWKYLQENISSSESRWFANHPTLCFRKSTLLELKYSTEKSLRVIHDYEFLVRWLRTTGGEIHNLKDVLLMYRIHEKQLTYGLDFNRETQLLQLEILS